MSSENSLMAEVHAIVDGKLKNGDPVRQAWVVTEIMAKHPLTGEQADFYRGLAAKEIGRVVTAAIGRAGMSDDPESPQMTLPGHKRLVKAYPVTRGGERVLVAIEKCTNTELIAHVDLLRKQAKGCDLHADELAMFVASRQEKAAS